MARMEKSSPVVHTTAQSVFETARRIGVDQKTVRRLIDRRELGHIRIGKRVLISEQQLQAFLASRVVPAVDCTEITNIF